MFGGTKTEQEWPRSDSAWARATIGCTSPRVPNPASTMRMALQVPRGPRGGAREPAPRRPPTARYSMRRISAKVRRQLRHALTDPGPDQGGNTMAVTLTVNGRRRTVAAAPETPLLYILRNDLELNAAKFGCCMAQCGACTVLVNGRPVRSCVTPALAVANTKITTLEGLGSASNLHPLKKAFIDEQAAQCGYCIAGMLMPAKGMLDETPHPTEAEIRQAVAGNLCRCGTHNRIVRAIQRAAKEMSP